MSDANPRARLAGRLAAMDDGQVYRLAHLDDEQVDSILDAVAPQPADG